MDERPDEFPPAPIDPPEDTIPVSNDDEDRLRMIEDFLATMDALPAPPPKPEPKKPHTTRIGSYDWLDEALYGVENKSFYFDRPEDGDPSEAEASAPEDVFSGRRDDPEPPSVTPPVFAPRQSIRDEGLIPLDELPPAPPVSPPPPVVPAPAKQETPKKKRALLPQKGDSVGAVLRKCVFLISILTLAVCVCYFANLYGLQPYLERRNSGLLDALIYFGGGISTFVLGHILNAGDLKDAARFLQ